VPIGLPESPGASAAEQSHAPLLRVTHLSKTFPGLKALDDVSLEVGAGEIVAIVGQNGSGKSTLVKILAGIYHPDPGALIEGYSPDEKTIEPELRFIHQDLGLVDALTAVENLDLARKLGVGGLGPVHSRREGTAAAEATARFGGSFDVTRTVRELSAAERTILAITRAMDGWTTPGGVLVLDEPTAALPDAEARRLFASIRRVAEGGAGVIFISHHLNEVMELSDRVIALRDGRVVADLPVAEVDRHRLISLIAGRAVNEVELEHHSQDRSVALSAAGVRGLTVRGVDLELGEGEIVGVAGLLGSGREDLASLLFGAVPRSGGEVRVGEVIVRPNNPAEAIDRGMAFVPADRHRHAAVMTMNVRENLTLPRLSPLRHLMGHLNSGRERLEARAWSQKVGLSPLFPERKLELFSGGNQQKVVLAKWLRISPRVLLLDEPTQGVDVGAKAAIYELVGQAAKDGTAILVSSSDSRELALLCDRVVVLRDGCISTEIGRADLTEPRLIRETMGLQALSDPSTNQA
jgi:ABC-type sugar transport system ATPase subunit